MPRSTARLQGRRGDGRFIETFAHVLDKVAGLSLGQARDHEGIEPSRAFDADPVPDQTADVGNLGDVRHRQMLVGAPPGRQPEQHDVGGDADMVGDQARRKYPAREAEMKERLQAARAHFDAIVGGRCRSHESLLAGESLAEAGTGWRDDPGPP